MFLKKKEKNTFSFRSAIRTKDAFRTSEAFAWDPTVWLRILGHAKLLGSPQHIQQVHSDPV